MLVLVDDAVEKMDWPGALEALPPDRRQYALRYRREIDRRLSAAVYLLLAEALRVHYGIASPPRLAYAPGGKPYLADYPDIHFNFSHCAKAAVCAVADHPVGIDVETLARAHPAVAQRVLSPAEFAAVQNAAEPDVAFVRLWTQKESLIKLRGAGLEDNTLANLLETARGVTFETTVKRDRGYVLTTAS